MTELTKTFSTPAAGAYRPTLIDAAKAQADILIEAVDGTYTVCSRVALSGRGIKQPYSNPDMYEVTAAALARLQERYNVRTNF